MKETSYNSFFSLICAGLWEQEVQLQQYGEIDFSKLMSLAEEQSVVGLVAAGLEHVTDIKLPKEDVLQFVGQALQLEQRNEAMNAFIAELIEKLRRGGVYTLLVKGQGIAQCYERPILRACGDVDLFLSDDNYNKAQALLSPIASSVDKEGELNKHLGMTIDQWVVELHGKLYTGLSHRVDSGLGDIYDETFYGGDVRSWENRGVTVYLLGITNDIVYVFAHILQHFYKGGIGLRQICDWCRLLWQYRDQINLPLLENKIKKMGLMTEWKAFGALAVNELGMPSGAMPFFDNSNQWRRKSRAIKKFVMMSGNFGQNRDNSYYGKYPYVIRKLCSFGRRIGDLSRHAMIFPLDSLRFFPRIMINGLKSAANGE